MENHRDVFEGDRFAFNPTFSTQLGEDTSLLLSYEYVDDDRVVDRGIPSFGSAPLRGVTDTFFGDPDLNNATFEANVFKARAEHLISSDWTVNGSIQYADYDKLYQNLFPVGFDANENSVSLDGYIDDTTDRENLLGQVNFIGEFDTGPLRHRLLLGLEYADQDTDNTRRDSVFAEEDPLFLDDPLFTETGGNQITFNFSDPLVIPEVGFPILNRDRASQVETQSFFIQDQIDIGEHFIVIAGARYDRFDINVTDFFVLRNGATDGNDGFLNRVDEEISPRIGLIYKPVQNISVYASYNRTFLPRSGDQFLTLTLDQEALEPEVFTNKEIGFKWDISRGFSLSASLFELERDSGTTIDPNDAGNTILISSVTQGIELQLAGDITENWSVNLGYSNLDANEDGRIDNGVPANRTLAQVPENQFSLWSRYDVNQKFGFGAGLIYQSGQFATISNRVELPSFTRVDAALFYALDKKTGIQLNIENLFDEEYFPTAHTDDNITTGAPINARLSINRRF